MSWTGFGRPGNSIGPTCSSAGPASASSRSRRTIGFPADDPAGHVAGHHPGDAAEHLALAHAGTAVDRVAESVGELDRLEAEDGLTPDGLERLALGVKYKRCCGTVDAVTLDPLADSEIKPGLSRFARVG